MGVVIPVHNRPSVLIETLVHVIAQSLTPSKLVIVDDGSTDDTADRAEEWLLSHSPSFGYTVLRTPKTSAADSRQRGFREVESFPYVAFLDSDDHWPADFLERCVSALEENPDAVAATVDREFVSVSGDNVEDKGGGSLVADPIAWIFEHGAGISSSSLLRTEAYVAAGGWPTYRSSSEDVELVACISLLGPWLLSPGKPVRFHIGNSQRAGETDNLSRIGSQGPVRWAHDFEEIYEILKKRAPERDFRPLRKSIARRWALAARVAQKSGDLVRARDYYGRAFRMRPFSLKSFRRWLECTVRTIVGAQKS